MKKHLMRIFLSFFCLPSTLPFLELTEKRSCALQRFRWWEETLAEAGPCHRCQIRHCLEDRFQKKEGVSLSALHKWKHWWRASLWKGFDWSCSAWAGANAGWRSASMGWCEYLDAWKTACASEIRWPGAVKATVTVATSPIRIFT